jgi:putative transposase
MNFLLYICIVLKGYKYRLYPTAKQAELINKHIGACRFVYNLALETKNYAYTLHRKNISCFDLMNQLPDLKKECEWLKEIDSQALQQSVINLDKSFTAFFKGQSKFPKFKNKHSGTSFRNPHGSKVLIIGNKVSFPKFKGGIKFAQDRTFEGEIRQSTVSRTSTGKYFISVLVEDGKELPVKSPIKEDKVLGVDLGLSHFIITSDGIKIDNPRHLKKSLSKLKYLQRQASKKKKGSNNRKKANLKVSLIHEKITNQRKDFLHKLSTRLISENQALCFEDLNVQGMVKNHKLAQSISDVSWSTFVDMCKYKAEWNGKHILQIPTFEPSTKICSSCGHTKKDLTLKDREWDCICGAHHDRDINAAINIKNYCMKNNGGGLHRQKPVELPTLVGALKQEVNLYL